EGETIQIPGIMDKINDFLASHISNRQNFSTFPQGLRLGGVSPKAQALWEGGEILSIRDMRL
ncbi:MAG: hypothetical protein ACFNUE_07685, partial [Bacteroides sp.]